MIYFLHGSDFKKSREKLKSILSGLLSKKPNATFFKLDGSNFSEDVLSEFIQSQSLFSQKYIVQADGLFDDKEIKDIILGKLKEIQNSENIFIFIESVIDKTSLKKIEKIAEKVQEFNLPVSSGRKFGVYGGGVLDLQDFNIFNLADAFGQRDKKKLWVLYQKTILRNIPPEETHGVLLWQLRSMIVAKNSSSVSESGLKSFVYNKSLRMSKNYKDDELKEIYSKLVALYHDARLGLINFDISIEKFILGT
ncbi:hypothetical protein ACFLY7_01195 [Patescibacteria group bacterium]